MNLKKFIKGHGVHNQNVNVSLWFL